MKESKEKLSNSPSVVIIDDAHWIYEEFTKNLLNNGFDVKYPLKDEAEGKSNQSITDFENKLNNIDKNSTFLVITDQFYEYKEHIKKEITQKWIKGLLETNKNVKVIETSFVPEHPSYNNNNPTLNSGRFAEVGHIFETLPLNNKQVILEIMENVCNSNYLLAQKLDPNSRPQEYELKNGFEKLFEISRFSILYNKIARGIETEDEFIHRLRELKSQIIENDEIKNSKQALILHTAFMTIFYMQKYNDLDRFALTINRLKSLLGLPSELDN